MLAGQRLWTGVTHSHFFPPCFLSSEAPTTSCVSSDKLCKDMATGDWLNNPLHPLSQPAYHSIQPPEQISISPHTKRWATGENTASQSICKQLCLSLFLCLLPLCFVSRSFSHISSEFTQAVCRCYRHVTIVRQCLIYYDLPWNDTS